MTNKTPGRIGKLKTLSSLSYKNFRYLWISTVLYGAASWMQIIVLGWLIYELTDSPFLVGALQAAWSFPFLLVGPLSGVMSDRMDRKKLLQINQVLMGTVTLCFAIVVTLGWERPWNVFVLAILTGCGWAMNVPLRQAILPNVVPKEALMNAIALSSTAFSMTQVLGPAVGGLIIAYLGPSTVFYILAGLYVTVIILLMPIKLEVGPSTGKRLSSVATDTKEGLAYVMSERSVLASVLMGFIPQICIVPFTTGLMPVFAKDVLGLQADGLGILYSSVGIGGLLGAVFIASIGNVGKRGFILMAMGVLAGITVMAFSRSNSLAIALAALSVLGLFRIIFDTLNNTNLQIITPEKFRGRVMSIYMLNHGIAPLGAVVAGTIANFYGSPAAVAFGGAATVAFILAVGIRFGVANPPRPSSEL